MEKKQDDLIIWLGECVVPQHFDELDKKFGLNLLVEMAKSGLIVRSVSTSSFNIRYITTAKPKGRFIELSDKGWELYEDLRKSKPDHQDK